MNAQGAPAWLVEGATVAVTYRGVFTNRDCGVELHTVTRVGKATCTLSTGDKYSVRTLDRESKENVVMIARLADPEDRMIKATLRRQEREKARGLIHRAYEQFNRHAGPENTQALIDQLTKYRKLSGDDA